MGKSPASTTTPTHLDHLLQNAPGKFATPHAILVGQTPALLIQRQLHFKIWEGYQSFGPLTWYRLSTGECHE
jgi:hypothetical protein